MKSLQSIGPKCIECSEVLDGSEAVATIQPCDHQIHVKCTEVTQKNFLVRHGFFPTYKHSCTEHKDKISTIFKNDQLIHSLQKVNSISHKLSAEFKQTACSIIHSNRFSSDVLFSSLDYGLYREVLIQGILDSDTKVVADALDLGMSTNTQVQGKPILSIACEKNDFEMVQLLTNRGVDLNILELAQNLIKDPTSATPEREKIISYLTSIQPQKSKL